MIRIAITGHRPHKLGNEYNYDGKYTSYIKKEIIKIIDSYDREKTVLVTGMALGTDTIFALLGLELGFNLEAALPCEGQEKLWVEKSQKLYKSILSKDKVKTILVNKGGYYSYKMKLRDEYMVDNCSKLIAVWNGLRGGGTYHTVNYARQIGRDIEYINPEGWKISKKPVQRTLFDENN